jgi:predicted ATPase
VAQPHPGERGLAYGVLAQLLRDACRDGFEPPGRAVLEDAARLLPELGPAPASTLDEPGARLRFLESVCTLIADAFGEAAGVVFVDDLHLCDPASLDALAYLARRLDRRRLLVLGARRTDEPDPDHRCAALAALAERVVLARLGHGDVIELALRRGLDDAAAEQLFRDTEGLPLFLAELLSAGGGGGITVGGVRAALEGRLDAVSEAGTQVLAAAALIGRTFDAETVRIASGRSDTEVAEALEELTTRGLIVERDAAYDFGHERLRVIAEERVGLARRRLLHRRIAEAQLGRHEDAAIVARHLELAGRDAEAAQAHASAAEKARTLLAPTEAVQHLEAAIALGHPEPAALYEAIGDIRVLRAEYRQALSAYDAAGAAGDPAGSGALEQKIGAVHERRGDWQLAESHYEQALRLGAAAASVQTDRSRVAWRQDDVARSRVLALEALALAEKADDARAAAQAHNILGLAGEGRDHLERSLEIAVELDDPGARIAALNSLARDLTRTSELARAQELLGTALELCRKQGDLHHEAALHNNLADVLHKAGADEQAMQELKRAVAVFARIGSEDEELRPGVWSLADW